VIAPLVVVHLDALGRHVDQHVVSPARLDRLEAFHEAGGVRVAGTTRACGEVLGATDDHAAVHFANRNPIVAARATLGVRAADQHAVLADLLDKSLPGCLA
jgi:hypothetical protein